MTGGCGAKQEVEKGEFQCLDDLLSLSLLYPVWDARAWDGAVHIQGSLSSPAKSLGTPWQTQRCASLTPQVFPTAVKLMMEIIHPSERVGAPESENSLKEGQRSSGYASGIHRCSLNENGPHRLMCLNT